MEHHEHHHEEKSIIKTYTPLILVIGGILLATAVTQIVRGNAESMEAMRIFIGLFFVTFGFFKTLDWKGFIDAYAEYDIIAMRSRAYAAIYPAIEILLGTLYLAGMYLTYVNIATIIVMGIGSIGVIRTVRDKKKIHCACLGAVIKLPMTTVTVIEDLGMVLMAVLMLVL